MRAFSCGRVLVAEYPLRRDHLHRRMTGMNIGRADMAGVRPALGATQVDEWPAAAP
jgi:hypothetical protein